MIRKSFFLRGILVVALLWVPAAHAEEQMCVWMVHKMMPTVRSYMSSVSVYRSCRETAEEKQDCDSERSALETLETKLTTLLKQWNLHCKNNPDDTLEH